MFFSYYVVPRALMLRGKLIVSNALSGQGEAPEDVRRSKRHRTESGGFAKSESAANPAQSPVREGPFQLLRNSLSLISARAMGAGDAYETCDT